VREYGDNVDEHFTAWEVLGGPVIGFQYKGEGENMSIIVGDKCRPKYFGSRKLILRLGEEREVRFDWQTSDTDH
jgi:hypothetical protein